MNSLLPNKSRAKAAIIMLWVMLVISVISIFSSVAEISTLNDIKKGIATDAQIAANDSRESLIAIIYLIAWIISAATFIRWFHRAYQNLSTITNATSKPPKSAISCWFIPFANLAVPRMIMGELWQKSEDVLAKRSGETAQSLSTNLLSLWWTLFIVMGVTAQIASKMYMRAEYADQYISADRIYIFSEVIGVIAAYVTIKMIKTYSQKEDALATLTEEEMTCIKGLYDLEKESKEAPVAAKA